MGREDRAGAGAHRDVRRPARHVLHRDRGKQLRAVGEGAPYKPSRELQRVDGEAIKGLQCGPTPDAVAHLQGLARQVFRVETDRVAGLAFVR